MSPGLPIVVTAVGGLAEAAAYAGAVFVASGDAGRPPTGALNRLSPCAAGGTTTPFVGAHRRPDARSRRAGGRQALGGPLDASADHVRAEAAAAAGDQIADRLRSGSADPRRRPRNHTTAPRADRRASRLRLAAARASCVTPLRRHATAVLAQVSARLPVSDRLSIIRPRSASARSYRIVRSRRSASDASAPLICAAWRRLPASRWGS